MSLVCKIDCEIERKKEKEGERESRFKVFFILKCTVFITLMKFL